MTILEGFAIQAGCWAVMERTPHVLLAGAGASAFAAAQGLEPIADPRAWFTNVAMGPTTATDALATGTVGCVALDANGALAGATSTAGVLGKLWGRVGDSLIAGAGVWADRRVAVSCTGPGEYFLRCSAAAQISWRIAFAGEALRRRRRRCWPARPGAGRRRGGLIAVDARGDIAMPFNSEGMKRARLAADGGIILEVF